MYRSHTTGWHCQGTEPLTGHTSRHMALLHTHRGRVNTQGRVLQRWCADWCLEGAKRQATISV